MTEEKKNDEKELEQVNGGMMPDMPFKFRTCSKCGHYFKYGNGMNLKKYGSGCHNSKVVSVCPKCHNEEPF